MTITMPEPIAGDRLGFMTLHIPQFNNHPTLWDM